MAYTVTVDSLLESNKTYKQNTSVRWLVATIVRPCSLWNTIEADWLGYSRNPILTLVSELPSYRSLLTLHFESPFLSSPAIDIVTLQSQTHTASPASPSPLPQSFNRVLKDVMKAQPSFQNYRDAWLCSCWRCKSCRYPCWDEIECRP
jgi:hypothetical protein